MAPSWPWNSAKLPLERRFGRPNGVKLALERRLGRPDVDLALERSVQVRRAPSALTEILYRWVVFRIEFDGGIRFCAAPPKSTSNNFH